jgi:beta-galactosidase
MQVGVDYYPEHWVKELWATDADAMRDAGISIVRLAEFAWSKMERTEGEFDFTWLDEAIGIFQQRNIDVVLGTPTATPPNWLVENYPDVLPVNQILQTVRPGVRWHRCYNSPSLRKYSEIIIRQMAQRYATHSGVIGWQTDNEFQVTNCHCEHCTKSFREWLQHKYQTLEGVNEAWGTIVWSGTYTTWEQVTTPLGGSPHQNPSLLLDYQRFNSDSIACYNAFQAGILRKLCPAHFITHNIWGYPVPADYYDMFESMDFVSVDYYPSTDLKDDSKANIYHGALTLDLTRGVKRDNFWVMEQLSGTPGCWNPMSRTPYPGMIKAHAWQSVSRGADVIVNFRWRTARVGAEQFWHGLHDHHGEAGRRVAEFTEFAQELNQLSPLLDGTKIVSEVAILFSHEVNNALNIQPQVDGFDYLKNVKTMHKGLISLGLNVDVINWEQNLSQYKIVVAPYLFLENPIVVKNLEEFASSGGTVVLSTRSGVKNMENVCLPSRIPGALRTLVGSYVEEYDPIGHDTQSIIFNSNYSTNSFQWCDIVQLETARSLGYYTSEYYQGEVALTENVFGAGKAIYIGSVLAEDAYRAIFKPLLDEQHVDYFGYLPDGVEISVRSNEDKRIVFLLNLSNQENHIVLNDTYQCANTSQIFTGLLNMKPGEVKVMTLK